MNTWKLKKKLKELLTKRILKHKYIEEGKSSKVIAKECNCSAGVILLYLRKCGISIRNRSEAQLTMNCQKLKGHIKSDDGYYYTYVPKHPYKTARKYVFEHRLVMEAYLNKVSLKKWLEYGRSGNYPKYVRFLTRKEIVHHINGKTRDNSIENLMLFPNISAHQIFKHLGQKTFICKKCGYNQRGAKNI